MWSITCSTVMASLPFGANSGMYSMTSLAGSTSPSPINVQTVDATNAFVAENAGYLVSRSSSP